jgi:hypothetical protein
MGRLYGHLHAPACRLDFGDDPKSIDIHAMVSGEGERVALGKNLKVSELCVLRRSRANQGRLSEQ